MTGRSDETELRLLQTQVANYKELCTRQQQEIDQLERNIALDRWIGGTLAANMEKENHRISLTWRIDQLSDPKLRAAIRDLAERQGIPNARRINLYTGPRGPGIRLMP